MPRIMIVDDDRTTVTLLETLLSMDGFDVSLVALGSDVLPRAQQEKPDIFLIDYHLADVDGTEIIRALRVDPTFASAPIVMASGMNREKEAKDAGANLFLYKPLDPSTLADTLYGML